MIKHVEMQALQIGYFAGDMDGENLPAAIGDRFRPMAEAFDDEAAFGGAVAVADDDLIGLKGPHRDGQPANGLRIFPAKN